ncbi:set1/Ash2 histone methyltransferase complex subunit ASH2 isoform X1 [Plutella xylostella]|uniref:set1/Ash2 histone methyltransferase complex subunit ASH2 isoform X2 n=1 Tax=Plutella xylostella TaxID=51655 RepID=UPI0020326854|nr:set1/Ash2 histone methyltransferase complex subunit ASH2 isoform X2 [Plutella xylostella]XP_048479106.1 set1/Ash2 histone methyltransferase complex subunit ASH2 isoform X1 [Plutella xylostella]
MSSSSAMEVKSGDESDAHPSTHGESLKSGDLSDKNYKANKNSSDQQGSCYCGKERNLNIVELLCASCHRWFHESCIGYQLGKLVPFMTNYLFICKNCSPTGLETFKKNQAPFPQMCLTAIANLQHESSKDGGNKLLFSKDREIIPYIDQYWEAMTTMPRRVTQSWYATVQRALIKDIQVLFIYEEDALLGPVFGLYNVDLTAIKPNYEAMIKQGQLKVTDMGIATIPLGGNVKGRQGKRRPAVGPEAGAPQGKKGRSADLNALKLPSHGYPTEHPFNKDGYRYILAEPDPHAPFRQVSILPALTHSRSYRHHRFTRHAATVLENNIPEFDESNELSGKPIPGWLYRALRPGGVLLALHDRAPQLRVAEDRLAATGDRGYCMLRATHGVQRGAWYWEASVEELPEGAAARLGWGRRYANLQAPLGYDKFGYSWRSRKGTRFHESRGKHYSAGYGEGDTLGFLIVLPAAAAAAAYLPNTYKDRPLVKFKSHLYYEDKDNIQESLNNLKPLPGSKIYFFKNGECQGEAFADIYEGCYYPSVSLHKNITVSVNFGPNFKCPPLGDYTFRPMSEKAEEAICEQTMADLLYLTENEGKLRLDNFNL